MYAAIRGALQQSFACVNPRCAAQAGSAGGHLPGLPPSYRVEVTPGHGTTGQGLSGASGLSSVQKLESGTPSTPSSLWGK